MPIERPTARTADKFDLYERTVQAPADDAALLAKFGAAFGARKPRTLREDFCGTAALSAAWVAGGKDRDAVGVDLDGPTLAAARRRRAAELDAAQLARLRLLRADVRAAADDADVVAALNFSWQVFATRPDLHAYFAHAASCVRPGGVLVADVWGGSETQLEMVDRRRMRGFTYVWERKRFDPLTYRAEARIHFEFRDGTALKNAFTYRWRLWPIPDLREAMEAAGLENVVVLWEGTNPKTGSGDGRFRVVDRGEPCRSYIAYVVGRKPAGKSARKGR